MNVWKNIFPNLTILCLLPPATKLGKVIFSQASVILSTGGGGGIPACIAGGIPACLAAGLGWGGGSILLGRVYCQGGAWSGGVPGPGSLLPGRCLVQGGLSRPIPKGEIEGDQVQAHTQRGN